MIKFVLFSFFRDMFLSFSFVEQLGMGDTGTIHPFLLSLRASCVLFTPRDLEK